MWASNRATLTTSNTPDHGDMALVKTDEESCAGFSSTVSTGTSTTIHSEAMGLTLPNDGDSTKTVDRKIRVLKSCFEALVESTRTMVLASAPTIARIDTTDRVIGATKYSGNLEEADLDFESDFADPTKGPPFNELTHDVVHEFRGTSGDEPENFRMQLMPSDEDWPNEKLEDAMTLWYNKYYFMPDRPVSKVDMNCYYAAYLPNGDRWVRCWTDYALSDGPYEQNGVDLNCDVRVELIDHGIEMDVKRRHLLPLRKKYLELPIQAFLGRLDIMDGRFHRWTPKVRDQFEEDLKGENFYGLVTRCSDNHPSPYRTVHLVMFYDFLEMEAGVLEEKQVLYLIEGLKCGYKKIAPQASAAGTNVAVVTEKGEKKPLSKKKTKRERLLTLLEQNGYSKERAERLLDRYKRQ